MKFTYYGHSCFSVFVGGKNLLFDPFVTPNALASSVDVDKIDADYIFVSHGHLDHIADVTRIADRTGATIVANWEVYEWFTKSGQKNVHPMNPGGQVAFDFGMVKCLTAHHSSSLPDGAYGGVACGFAVKTADGNFYYSGDTALTLDMQLVPEWTTLDFAVFPIGDTFTMGAEDAVKAARFVGVKQVIGVHYDTFGFIKIDHAQAVKTFQNAGVELHLLEIGSVLEIE